MLPAERKLTVLMAEQSIVHPIAIADRPFVLATGASPVTSVMSGQLH